MAERRARPRIELSAACTLRRRSGAVIAARTLDLGAGGMAVTTARPLMQDEVLEYALELALGERVDGRARVLREVGFQRYALRFEAVAEPLGRPAGGLAH